MDNVNPLALAVAVRLDELITALEEVGEMANVCVSGTTERRCPYCKCGGSGKGITHDA